MDTPAPLADRPTPVLRACDGVPWPSDDELEAEEAWTRWAWHDGDATGVVSDFPDDDLSPLNPVFAAASDLDAILGRLELITAERHRLEAEEARLIAAVLRDAAADPTPWVGPDPTIDLACDDPRGRTVGAVRRDRVDLAQRAAAAEIAVRLRLSEQTVRTRAARVEVLQERCPALWHQFAAGATSERHAIEASRLASSLPDDDTATWQLFDAGAAEAAIQLVPTKFAVTARALRERVHAESLDVRHRRAAGDRGVWMTAELDGMASLSALMPADKARGLMSRLDRAARHLHAAPDEERTLAQLRADVLADLRVAEPADAASAKATPRNDAHADASRPTSPSVDSADSANAQRPISSSPDVRAPDPARAALVPSHSGESFPPDGSGTADATPAGGSPPSADPPATTYDRFPPLAPPPPPRRRPPIAPGPTVVITVPALTLLGTDDAPPTLEGYGPIDLDTARRLAGEASSWVRLVTHPVTGAAVGPRPSDVPRARRPAPLARRHLTHLRLPRVQPLRT
ncbi:DUF222 domain-containing protein [Microbacterium sp. SORGH_AS_0344]|uniref:DUF222 domain-containing protein n=1 Tax=Microbacterium sp. SORGH_AS_0344 TaxID=3041767 RepID=UPI00278B8881|nr:DUF222 domain-containing protein [Microbacterium sp. SORGH_AS_0344]MDQ1084354.1 hypothetical protein [Microbacterium sp. SORGH_AS_0344]